MKKLLILLSAILLLVGCGSTSQNNTPPTTPKLTATTSQNPDGGTLVSWQSNDPTITSVVVETTDSNLLYTGAPNDSYVTQQPVRLVAYAASVVVETLFINLPSPPPPPPTNGLITFTVSWSLPTTYSDGTPIATDNIALMTVELYYNTTGNAFSSDNTLIATSTAGATSVTIVDWPVTYDFIYYFGVRCHISPDGLWSEVSPPYDYFWPTP